MYDNYRVYGPYLQSNGKRKIVVLIDELGNRKTTAYARYLLEKHLNRELLPTETVDHIDKDSLNDSLENLRVLSRSSNIKRSSKRAKYKRFKCPVCSINFWILLRVYKYNQLKQGKAGPYCSKICAGKAHN